MKKSRQKQSDKEIILKIDIHDGINDNYGYDDTTDHATGRRNSQDIEKKTSFVDLETLKSHQKSQIATSDKKSLLTNAEICEANEDANYRMSEQRPVSAWSIGQEQSSDFDDNDVTFERRTLQRSSFYDNMKNLKGSYEKHIKRSDRVQHSQSVQRDGNNLTNVDTAECSSNIAKFQCFECVQAIPVSSSDKIKPGDHVVFKGVIYDHHGIIKSKNGDELDIIEATNTFCGAVLGLFFGGKARIKSSTKKFDFTRQKIYVVRYSEHYQIKQIISHAEAFQEKKYKYNVLKNNCEHFATSCVTGKNISVQVSKIRLAWKLFWSSGFVGLSDDMKRNEKAKKKNLICENCYEMNKKLLSVEKIPIKFKTDIEIGDIIRYTHWNLWHEAVVLSIDKTTKKTEKVVCSIAHYAFCGLFSHREIKKERKEIQLNGKCLKLNYTAAKYNVFEPKQVVRRAEDRLNEQDFVFFSNDSSHFARWCKLTRFKKELEISSEELLAHDNK